MHKNTVIIIAGPTAVGKTSLAIDLAKHFGTEIISADSRQCFKELNIGVAKPTTSELNEVHHYFINSHSIQDEVNAGIYEQYALEATSTIFQNNPVAILVGGTGLYIKTFAEGIDIMPTIPSEIREQIISSYQSEGLHWLQNEIAKKDPAFWAIAEQQNPQRLMRALEVVLTTGQSINQYRSNQKVERPFNIIKIALELPRAQLVENINTRIDQMMEEGLLEEVKSLLPYQHLNALQTVGYKEFFAHFNGECSIPQAINQLKINTRHYAKRQMTWFKRDTDFQWFINQGDVLEQVLEIIADS